MDEESISMCEKILVDIEHIFNGNHNLQEFTIVPINESRNKSPVLYEEHCLGLESWCIKHILRYVHKELFQYKRLLNKDKLIHQKLKQINKLLISALLIHPDVTTFWNMRRKLIEKGIINVDKELILTKLVLSYKNKSNECFTYRRWIIKKLTKNICNNAIVLLLNNEFSVMETIAEKSPNNYHAWTHRIWCIENILTKTEFVETEEYLNMVLNQLEFSDVWINKHISEHTGFHYRQYLCNSILKNRLQSSIPDLKYHCLIEPFIGIKFCDNIAYLNSLLGKWKVDHIHNTSLKYYNYVYYFVILLSDLFCYIDELNDTFPGHESIWYHRRYVVYSLLKAAYDYHDITWKQTLIPNKLSDLPSDVNVIDVNNITGEKSPKLLKYNTNKVESCYLYKLIVESETKFIKKYTLDQLNCVQRELAIRHGKWLKFILGLNQISI